MTTEESQLVELGLKALGGIAPLIPRILERTKDKESRAMIEQMRVRYDEAHSGLLAAQRENIKVQSDALKVEHENFELKRKMANIQDAHSKEMSALKDAHTAEITRLTSDPPKIEFSDGFGCGDIPNIM